MPNVPAAFDTPHNEAFRALGALEPGQQWSAFDVHRDQARAGNASRFVTTLWNFHSTLDQDGHRFPAELAIARDKASGTLWYRIAKPSPGETRKTWVAHWNGLELAFANDIPIIGVLKDVHTSRCSLANVFDCGNPRMQLDGSALWLEVQPRAGVGCEVGVVDIKTLTGNAPVVRLPAVLDRLHGEFEVAVATAMKRSPAQRAERLAVAPRLPRRIDVTTTVFERNPDVVAQVLWRAGGVCEGCRRPAPFIRKHNGAPYLEVHHRERLADGGEDTVENAIALCPNCHREEHYG